MFSHRERLFPSGGGIPMMWGDKIARALLEAHERDCMADRDRTRQAFDEIRREQVAMESRIREAQIQMEQRLRESHAQMHAENSRRFDELSAANSRIESMSWKAMGALVALLLSVVGFGVEHFFGKFF